MTPDECLVEDAKAILDRAKSVLVLTGAGISAESGVPTFRTAGGLWNNIDPYKVATPEAFAADPVFVWRWYDERRTGLKECRPNAGHLALTSLENRVPRFFLLTQNVDDLHEQAGSRNPAHIHGRIWQTRCTREGTVRENRLAPLPEIPPRCPDCGAMERPNVVWFGETIDEGVVKQTERFLSEGEVDAVLVIGTEASFGYIARWAQRARGVRGTVIEVNPAETGFSGTADLCLRGPSGEILPRIVDL